MTAPAKARARYRVDGTPTRCGVAIEEYEHLHVFCGVPEAQVARQLGMTRASLLDLLRRAQYPRPEATVRADQEHAEQARMSRARVGRW